jgi:hypothetical protein
MRFALLGLMLPVAGCASAGPAPMGAAPAAVVMADAGQGARVEPNSPPNATVRIADKAEAKQVCWTEKVTGTLGRKQKVCRTERTERDGALMRKDLKTFQDRASGTQGQTLGAGGG